MFIFIDFIMFKLSLGKYSVTSKRKRHPINLSWEGEYEPVLEQILHKGDALFFSNKHSTISWLVQYFTRTDISHTGIYIGNGEVLHATLDGVRIDHLKSFFDSGCEVIPVSMQNIIGEAKKTKNIDISKYVGIKYTIKNTVLRGLYNLFGIPWRKFRITYIFDIISIVAFFSYVIAGQYFYLPFAIISSLYLLLVIVVYTYRNKLKIPIYDPGEGFYFLPKEAQVIPSVKKMNGSWFLDKFAKEIKLGRKGGRRKGGQG